MTLEEQFKEKYIQARVPDKAMLATYIKEAKGTERTMAEFAEACGTLTPSSFSRIIHGNLSKPLSAEVIQSIVRNADPRSKLSYRDMMHDNGMVPENEKGESEAGRERRILSPHRCSSHAPIHHLPLRHRPPPRMECEHSS